MSTNQDFIDQNSQWGSYQDSLQLNQQNLYVELPEFDQDFIFINSPVPLKLNLQVNPTVICHQQAHSTGTLRMQNQSQQNNKIFKIQNDEHQECIYNQNQTRKEDTNNKISILGQIGTISLINRINRQSSQQDIENQQNKKSCIKKASKNSLQFFSKLIYKFFKQNFQEQFAKIEGDLQNLKKTPTKENFIKFFQLSGVIRLGLSTLLQSKRLWHEILRSKARSMNTKLGYKVQGNKLRSLFFSHQDRLLHIENQI